MRATAPCLPRIRSTAASGAVPAANARGAASGLPNTAPLASAPVQPMKARRDTPFGENDRTDEDERRRFAAMGPPSVFGGIGTPGGASTLIRRRTILLNLGVPEAGINLPPTLFPLV